MCYDIAASLESQLKRALRRGDKEAARQIQEELLPLTDLPLYHASGFSHPKLLIYTTRSPDFPILAIWGLLPHWIRDWDQGKKIWNKTLNARGETIFEKPSFRSAARDNRCLIYVDGFYEHHHHSGASYPFFIYRSDGHPMIFAGLSSDWRDPDTGKVLTTFSIVTTEGNSLLSDIHNNPKLSGPRMPVILPDALADQWLDPIADERDLAEIQRLITPYPDEGLKAHTVGRLRGKAYAGNKPEISSEVFYPELA
ncbi:SOS response-associated peptidase [Robiginitalea aurantiaca]|uniref:Abasic site processing protein n=1 Tax=Robiginitalea aurantiaca TaxID=3056915 RepID=A0ABT7WHW7_9FLAO|nr:SOS response-associated peptidase [Robiginitalea aurantiaca]MDM9632511.1 SOS response-associated peptidase [Robiginitalea aurantiaca]